MENKYIIGLDFGTLSARALVVSCEDGTVMGEQVVSYAHGVITEKLPDGTAIPADYALADPQDYRNALVESIRGAVAKSGVRREDIIALGIDATTYTMVPSLADGTAVCELDGFASEPMAYIKLWKHNAALPQSDRVQKLFDEEGMFPVLKRYGSVCNCQFALPKLLETWEKAPAVFAAAEHFYDLGDWLAALLTGKRYHSLYSASYKELWSEETQWPKKEELDALSPGFGAAFYEKAAGEVRGYEAPWGSLLPEMAEKLGLNPGIAVASPMGDGSIPGVYFCIKEPRSIAVTVGTSLAMSFTTDEKTEMKGINGFSFGGIVPGRWSYDAGTPCAGDMLSWFVGHMVPQDTAEKARAENKSIHACLAELAGAEPWNNGLTVLDWWNGNRCILSDMSLRGSILGLGLATTTADMYCAFVQSIACSIRTILEHFHANGIDFDDVILCGGIPQKNRFLVEQIASIAGRSIKVSRETQLTAISAAILGAMAAGIDIREAAQRMTNKEYIHVEPDTAHKAEYDALYRRWKQYHDLLSRKA